MNNTELTDALIEHMAKTLWVMAYADWHDQVTNDCDSDNCGQPDDDGACYVHTAQALELIESSPSASCGQDWMKESPPAPEEARDYAAKLLNKILNDNACNVLGLLDRAAAADKVKIEDIDLSDFGHCLVMMSLGTGVSWFDDHERFELARTYIDDFGSFYDMPPLVARMLGVKC